jgi:hypothetical protein
MPVIQYAHICEYARIDTGGSVSIIGIFDTIHVPAVPANFPFIHVITSLTGRRGEKFHFATRMSAPDGTILQSAPLSEVAFNQDEGNVKQINGYLGVQLPLAGVYSFEFLIDNTVVHTIPFRVMVKPPHAG